MTSLFHFKFIYFQLNSLTAHNHTSDRCYEVAMTVAMDAVLIIDTGGTIKSFLSQEKHLSINILCEIIDFFGVSNRVICVHYPLYVMIQEFKPLICYITKQ